MSIVPASHLSSHDLRCLGNNISKPLRRRSLTAVKVSRAVNRSLARLGERVGELRCPTVIGERNAHVQVSLPQGA